MPSSSGLAWKDLSMLPVGRSRDANENLNRGVKRRISWRTGLSGSKQGQAGGVQMLSYGRRFAIWIPLPITASISHSQCRGSLLSIRNAGKMTAERTTASLAKNLRLKRYKAKHRKMILFCWTIFLITGGPGSGSLLWLLSSFACSCWSGCGVDSTGCQFLQLFQSLFSQRISLTMALGLSSEDRGHWRGTVCHETSTHSLRSSSPDHSRCNCNSMCSIDGARKC